MSSSSASRLALVRSSINVDDFFQVPSIVKPGQTLASTSYSSRVGGKGANVSAAIGLALRTSAQRVEPGQHETSPASVRLVAAVGKDAIWPIKTLQDCNVDTSEVAVLENDTPTGRAFIQVAADGENSIVLLPGANATRRLDDAERFFLRPKEAQTAPTHLVLQNEIPFETTRAFLRTAAQAGATTIFNPSPMLSGDEAEAFEWDCVDVLVVNEGEADALWDLLGGDGIAASKNICDLDRLRSIRWVVVTRGSRGVTTFLRGSGSSSAVTTIEQEAFKPRTVKDTTGAGDTFLGYLVAGLLTTDEGPGSNLPQSQEEIQRVLRTAVCAAAIAVESEGALSSIPSCQTVQEHLSMERRL